MKKLSRKDKKTLAVFYFIAIFIFAAFMDSHIKWLFIFLLSSSLAILILSFFFENEHFKNDIKANFEIKYRSSENEITTRKIFAENFDGKMIKGYCFLRNEERTFFVPRIIECVDLETGELVKPCDYYGDLRFYFNKKLNANLTPREMFDFDYWTKISFIPDFDFPEEIDGFEIDKKLKMEIVTLDGLRYEEFICRTIRKSMINENQFYVTLSTDSGEILNVDTGKIITVDGVENFGEYLVNEFNNSDYGKSSKLLKTFYSELCAFAYLGRADSSMTLKKRNIVCDYLKSVGSEIDDSVLSKTLRKISVDLNDFKKNVDLLSKRFSSDDKANFVRASKFIIGGVEKAKPFGLAGLQYIESKMSV